MLRFHGFCIEFNTLMTQPFFGKLQELFSWLFSQMLVDLCMLPIRAISEILNHVKNASTYLHYILLNKIVYVS